MTSGAARGPLDVVVLGAAGIDTNVFVAGGEVDFSVEANFAHNLDYVGGAGGYSSRGFARLGHRTAYIGYKGEDHNGALLASELAHDGIEMLLFVDPEGTRRSVNIMLKEGGRKNFYDAKGSMRLAPDVEACLTILACARLAYFSIENWTRHLLLPAKEWGLIVACDLQDVVSPGDPYRLDYAKHADFLFLSAANFPDPAPLVRSLRAVNSGAVMIVGMGSRGCALSIGDDVRFFPPVELDVPVIDTNGAGDGLAVGFLSSYLFGGYSLEDAVLRGQIAARFTCAQRADSAHLITRGELDVLHNLVGPAYSRPSSS